MKGITFGDLHSYRDFSLLLSAKKIGSPPVKQHLVDVPGADAPLDLTEYFGEPKFENVTHTFEFSTIVPQSEQLSLYSTVKSAIHGKKMRIILDDDPLFYYVGRCSVSPYTKDKSIGMFSVECDCEPYKLKLEKTVVSRAVDGTVSVPLTNGRKRAVPEVSIVTDGSIRIVYRGNIWDLGSGSYTLPELELQEGVNDVSVTGTGSVTFTYQEGVL